MPVSQELTCNTTGTELDKFAKVIFADNIAPYRSPAYPIVNPSSPSIDDWFRLVQKDGRGGRWTFKKQDYYIARSLRIPYYVMDPDGQEVSEHILVGYVEPAEQGVASPGNWTPATASTDCQKIAAFIVRSQANPFSLNVKTVPNWDARVKVNTFPETWQFRGSPVNIEKSIRVPYSPVDDAGNNVRAVMLLGYEGSGAY
jgi:hypothetical protein